MIISKEIKTKVFAQYIGSKISLDKSRFSEEEKDTTFTLSGVGLNAFQVEETRLWYNFQTMYDGELIDKLILKPLIAITDEHAIEMAKLFGGVEGKIILSRPTDLTNDDIHFAVQVYTNEPKWTSYNTPKYWGYGRTVYEYQWLQSKGYDVPHFLLGDKTLKECGLAIYEN